MSRKYIDRKPIVVFDTNMLILMAEGIPVMEYIEEEIETKPRYIVIKPVYDELAKIAGEETGLTRRKAITALEIARRYCEIVEFDLKQGESVDDAIIRFAVENKAIVATNDRELRNRVRNMGLPEAYLREESMRIRVEGYYK